MGKYSAIFLFAWLCACATRPADPTYSVGGDVTGLQGGSLTLSNGTSTVTLDADGQFTILTGVLGGAPYLISITASPANQLCTVQNAGGTVLDANIDSAHVVCVPRLYKVSGFLQGNGQVTVQNSNETITLPAAGAFSFSTGLPSGTAYAVTATPASNETCVVQNANGVVAGEVANVWVICSTNTYSIGGAVTGLNGAVGLALNGNSGVRLTENGNFTFPAQLPNSATYRVDVVVQPVGQTCVINDSNGVIAGANSHSVAVNCTTNPTGYTLGGEASGLGAPVSLTLNTNETIAVTNGPFAFTTVLSADANYAVTMGSAPAGQTCSLGGNPNGVMGNFSIANLTVTCASYLTYSNPNAAWVVGQADFVSNSVPSPPTANSLDEPYGGPAVANGVLFVADYENSRVMAYAFPPQQNGADANFQIGESSFASTHASMSRTSLYYNFFVATDGNVLVTNSAEGYSVVLYDPVPTAPGGLVSQSSVIGQHGIFNDDDYYGCIGDELGYPYGAWVAANHLYLADTYNNRIIVWNTIPTAGPGAPPGDLFFGASDANSCEPTAGGANGLNYPESVWSDGNRVVIADSGNARVLIWNTMPTMSNHAPDVVVGQPDFDTVGYSSTTRSTLHSPAGAVVYNNQLYVVDSRDHRVLIWNSVPTTNGAPADAVLGQPNSDPTVDTFTLNASGTTQQNLNSPTGIVVSDGIIVIVDTSNNRVVGFTPDS